MAVHVKTCYHHIEGNILVLGLVGTMPTIKVFHAPLGVAAPGGVFLCSFIAINVVNAIINHELGNDILIKKNDNLQIENSLIFFNMQSVHFTLTSVKNTFAELIFNSD